MKGFNEETDVSKELIKLEEEKAKSDKARKQCLACFFYVCRCRSGLKRKKV